jgi:hypothetical protein
MQLDDDGLRRTRAHAQRLSGPRRREIEPIVGTLVGVQAQDEAAAGLAIRARSRGVVADDVRAAIIDTRSLVLTWSLRGTRHIHHVADVRWLLDLLGPVFAPGSPSRRRQLGIAGHAGARAVRVVREALASEGPLPRSAIKERLARDGVDPSGQAPIHVLHRAALEGVLCIVPGRDGEESYVLLDDWIPRADPVPMEAAAAELARRYLRGYGPAAPADLARWSGLSLTVARRAWDAIADELAEVGSMRGSSWMMRQHARGVGRVAGSPGGARLLGAFDALLLGYADRGPFVASAHAREVNAGGGLIRPTVLVDARVLGTWKMPARRGVRRPAIELFGDVGPAVAEEIENEVRDVERFSA